MQVTSPPGTGPSPVTTQPCVRREESSLLHTWKKASRPADPAHHHGQISACPSRPQGPPEPRDGWDLGGSLSPSFPIAYTQPQPLHSLFSTITGNTWRSLCSEGSTWHSELKFVQGSATKNGALGHQRAVLTSAQEDKERYCCWFLKSCSTFLPDSFRYYC